MTFMLRISLALMVALPMRTHLVGFNTPATLDPSPFTEIPHPWQPWYAGRLSRYHNKKRDPIFKPQCLCPDVFVLAVECFFSPDDRLEN